MSPATALAVAEETDPRSLLGSGGALGNRFRILRELGSGGMGTVYEVFDRERRDRVALKTLQNASARALARLKREFRTLVDFIHPNIARLGELHAQDGLWYFTMELVRGTSFLRHVRVPGRLRTIEIDHDAPTVDSIENGVIKPVAAVRGHCDEPRLRGALSQLAQGLVALHRRGKVHRDVKSSNVMVAEDGRVVIVDFGTVADVDEVSEYVTGTPSHIAPEQVAGARAGAAADWYGMGVLLYEALTGRPPFAGSSAEILEQKQVLEPVPPRMLARGVPEDLDQLCMELLAREPDARIAGADVLRRLRARETPAVRVTAPRGDVFVGRRTELRCLHDAFRDVRAGTARVVIVQGRSGVGKSALVRQFCDEARAEYPDLVVLDGRCHERESVPYKALDGIIDALSRFLATLPKHEAAALLPARVAGLASVFPILELVGAITDSKLVDDQVDPQERRLHAFRALRELFVRLAARGPVLLTIDDLQWADVDSLAMLAELFRAGGSRLLLVATLRLGADQIAKQTIERRLSGIELRTLSVAELCNEDALRLASILCKRCDAPPDVDVERIVAEAEGNPFFIGELVRCRGAATVDSSSGLSEVLWRRIRDIEPSARRVLEILAIASGPVAQGAVAIAAGTDYAGFCDLTATLRAANLVRAHGVRGSDLTELYHDRVREAILANMDRPRRRMWHRRLAIGLERSGARDTQRANYARTLIPI